MRRAGRFKRKKMTPGDADRISDVFARSFGDTQQAMALGHALGYKPSAIRHAIREHGAIGAHWLHPARQTKWTQAQIDSAIDTIEMNVTLTLSEVIDQKVTVDGFPRISLSTLNSYLEHEIISYKMTTNQNQLRNAPVTKGKRQAYCQWFLANQHLNFVFIDEFGFNLSTRRKFGRSRAGTRAIQVTPAQEGANVSVVAAIQRGAGVVLSENQTGSYDQAAFETFVSHLIAHYAQNPVPNLCFIMDNCSIHNEASLQLVCGQHGIQVQMLPPYSPMLNPIEEVINDIKREIKTEISTTLRQQILAVQNLPWGQKVAARSRLLVQALGTAIGRIQVVDVDAHIARLYTFVPQAMALQDV